MFPQTLSKAFEDKGARNTMKAQSKLMYELTEAKKRQANDQTSFARSRHWADSTAGYGLFCGAEYIQLE